MSTPSSQHLNLSRGLTANKRMNLTVRPVTRLAGLNRIVDSHGDGQGARPSRPAGYPRR
jgi:hypothetical protein